MPIRNSVSRSETRATLGFAPHSGWAAVVAVAPDGDRVRVAARDRIEMANDPESKQPYHALDGVPLSEAEPRLQRFQRDAHERATVGLGRLLDGLTRDGHEMAAIGILESAGRKGGGLAEILASHALIHTADGDHFRAAIAAAAERRGLAVVRVKARDLEDEAARAIGRTRETLARDVRSWAAPSGRPGARIRRRRRCWPWLCLLR